ncbi:MAG: hypothetical protein IPI34_05630 [bacterium]|nr:hypothetical protein [bacterium]
MDHRRLWNALTRSRVPYIPLLVIAVLAAAGGARAQADVFCICTDPQDWSCYRCIDTPVFVATNIYLVLHQPSGAQVLSWEARLTHDNADGMIGAWTFSGVDADPDADNFVVDCTAAPLQPDQQNAFVLAAMQVIVVNAHAPILFYIGPVPGSTAFPDGTPGYVHTVGTATPAAVCGGDFSEPVFKINLCTSDAEGSGWGAIKALYGR